VSPPLLVGEGARTQPDWLFHFLKRPFPLRPLPKVRMPTFGFDDQEATDLVAMFSALDHKEYPFRFYSEVAPTDEVDLAVGKVIFEAKGCQSCHLVGDADPNAKLPPNVTAPNLVMAKQRLRAEWITRWLSDPEALQPGTAMPTVWTKNALEEVLAKPEQAGLKAAHGDKLKPYLEQRERQIEAVRNYLFVLQPGAAAATTTAAPPATEPPATGEPEGGGGGTGGGTTPTTPPAGGPGGP